MFKGERLLGNAYDASQCVNFDVRFAQCILDKLANLPAHSGDDLVAHLNYQHAWFAPQRASFESIAQQVGHLCRELHAAGARADDCESQRALRVLRRKIRRHAVERVNHCSPQLIGVGNLAEGNRVFGRAFNSRVIRNTANSEHQNVIREAFAPVL